MTLPSNKTYTGPEPEETTNHHEQYHPSLIEGNSDTTILLNAEGIITYITPSVASMLGYSPEELVDSPAQALVHPDHSDAIHRMLAAIRAIPGKSLSTEYRLRCKDGTFRRVEVNITNLLQVPAIRAIIGHLRDISMHKLAPHIHWGELDAPEHFVQFYETDTFLLDALSNFIETGLRADETCIVVATQEHRAGLTERLQASGLDLTAPPMRDRYIALDATETLLKFMKNGQPDSSRFTEVIGSLVERAAKNHRRVRIFGEMVAVLWTQGNQQAAIGLEALWNELHRTTAPFLLFCAYAMHNLAGEEHREQFTEICKQHSHVFPDETDTLLSSFNERLRAISLLQQKATSLQEEIAERKAAEEARLYLAAIVESSDDAILSKDLDGIITSWNAAAERMYGYSAQEIVGQPVTRIFLPDHQDEFRHIMERIRRGERVDHFETTRVRKDGRRLTVSVTVSPIKDRTGTIIGASAIARDITEQKQLEAKFQHLFDSNLIGVFISDFAGTFLEANDAFLHLLGYTRADLQAGALQRDAISPPEFHTLSQNALKALKETGASGTYEKEYLHKSGKRIPVLIAVARIDQSDTCIGFVLDISERKALDKRKDEFIGMASHELKTPVTSLKGFLGLLQRHLKGDEKTQHYLARMESQINKLTILINDLLDISKMQTGQLAYREERFMMDELIEEVVENIQETTQTHHVQIEGHSLAEVFGDRDRIGQVLINLLNNAIKYSPQADTVLVRVATDHNTVSVSVQDFGIGIAKEHQHRIFERFYQITDSKEKTYPGLGIGLYICREIVRRHKGRLWVESAKGKGATFHMTLPQSVHPRSCGGDAIHHQEGDGHASGRDTGGRRSTPLPDAHRG